LAPPGRFLFSLIFRSIFIRPFPSLFFPPFGHFFILFLDAGGSYYPVSNNPTTYTVPASAGIGTGIGAGFGAGAQTSLSLGGFFHTILYGIVILLGITTVAQVLPLFPKNRHPITLEV